MNSASLSSPDEPSMIVEGRRWAWERGVIGGALAVVVGFTAARGLLGTHFERVALLVAVVTFGAALWALVWLAVPHKSGKLFLQLSVAVGLFCLGVGGISLLHASGRSGSATFEPAALLLAAVVAPLYGVLGSTLLSLVWRDRRRDDDQWLMRRPEEPPAGIVGVAYGVAGGLIGSVAVLLFTTSAGPFLVRAAVAMLIAFGLLGILIGVLRVGGQLYMLAPFILIPLVQLPMGQLRVRSPQMGSFVEQYLGNNLIMAAVISIGTALIVQSRTNPETTVPSRWLLFLSSILSTYAVMNLSTAASFPKAMVLGVTSIGGMLLLQKTALGRWSLPGVLRHALIFLAPPIVIALTEWPILTHARRDLIRNGGVPSMTIVLLVSTILYLYGIGLARRRVWQRSIQMTPAQRTATGVGVVALLGGIAYLMVRWNRQLAASNRQQQAQQDALLRQAQEQQRRLAEAQRRVPAIQQQSKQPPVPTPSPPPPIDFERAAQAAISEQEQREKAEMLAMHQEAEEKRRKYREDLANAEDDWKWKNDHGL